MSSVAKNQVFSAVHTIGGLIPADMLVRISEGKDIKGSAPADYGVIGKRSVRDEAERHWDYLKSVWRELRDHLPVAPAADIPADPTGRAIAEWLMPLFEALGFGRRLESVGAPGILSDDGAKPFPISNRWRHVPMHLVAWNADLDKRPGGAGTVPPQSLVQECLNRTDAHLWAVLTNGRQLRLLRDSSALATASYVEFDLEAIFDGELFSEFVLLYRLLHESRFEIEDGAAASSCWLEKWRSEAIESGTRALEQLRKGVQQAITALGTGFLRHPANDALRNDFDAQALHNALLRLVYRLLFLFVAEDRDALHAPGAGDRERKRYADYFGSARLRDHARRRRGTAHSDLYEALRIVLEALGDVNGRPELGLPGIGGLFDEADADKPLRGLSLSNEYLLTAVRHLAQVKDTGSRRVRAVDYRHLDAEELGSVYESLLELVPKYSAVERKFELVELAGNTRKTTGSYYTPSSLIDCLLDSTLDPVIDDAVKRGEEKASAAGEPDPSGAIVGELLSLTVCDPACGSGHFLVAAARRIAKRVAAVRERNPEPTLNAMRHALHEVVARCIYGVDLNPMAVELAKVSLWLEALEPGKPLSFLDAHIKHGNALIGATPALLLGGIPNDAFKPIEGDDKKFAKALERQNANERGGQSGLFNLAEEPKVANAAFAASLRRITGARQDSLTDVRLQQEAYRNWADSTEYVHALHVADAWCSAFMWHKTPDAPAAITDEIFRALQDPESSAASESTHAEIVRLREQYRFFHWHLEFPEVFSVPDQSTAPNETEGWLGGFACILGNPPWELLEFKEQEFFSARAPQIANANGAARKKGIAKLSTENPQAFIAYQRGKREIDGMRHFGANSTLFPLCGRGRIKTDPIFVEHARRLINRHGRAGLIVPTGIATDATTQHFITDVLRHHSLKTVIGFVTNPELWSGVGGNRYAFCLFSMSGSALVEPTVRLASGLRSVSELGDPENSYDLTAEEIFTLSPNTGTCPVFRSRHEAEIALRAAARFAPLRPSGTTGRYQLTIRRLFNLGIPEVDSVCPLETSPRSGHIAILESKQTHAYNHRFATYSNDPNEKPRYSTPGELSDPRWKIQGRRSIANAELEGKLAPLWNQPWLFAWADVARNDDERTLLALITPRLATDFTLRVGFPKDPQHVPLLLAAFNSFAVDFLLRIRLGGIHVSDYILEQVPIPAPVELAPHLEFLKPRILELTFTSFDMAPFAKFLGVTQSAPFIWDENRRRVIRAEIDALFFHIYGIPRTEVNYILESFRLVQQKDMAKFGSHKTKDAILAEYDRMVEAGAGLENPLIDGSDYTSTLTPPPGHGPRHPAMKAEG